jgi:ABC-type antimicrobial peptide transport system permease subunit
LAALKKRFAESHPEIEMNMGEFQAQIDRGLALDRLLAVLSGFYGAAAVLASIGLYGVISYMVVQRQNEIGIRMALGANRGRVVRLVMRDVGVMLAAGTVIGLGAAFAATRTAQSLLFEISARDPQIFVAAITVLSVVTLGSAFLPARRASKVDPMTALRCD